MSIKRLKYLFPLYINKTGTPGEIQEFLMMLQEASYDKEIQILLDELWTGPTLSTPLSPEKAEIIFNKIVATSTGNTSGIYLKRAFWYKIAAVILLVSTFSVIFYKANLQSPVETVTEQPIKKNKPLRRFVNLPDGSYVILNENSKVEYGSRFGQKDSRDVYLTGEAYFDIKHDESRPFIVHTGELKVTVLGTAFNVDASPENEKVVVTVTRGKVKVGDNSKTYGIILPNQQIVYNRNQNQHITKQVKADEVVEWKNDDLYFDDVSMSDIANQLHERFHVDIAFSNENIKKCRFSATFLKSQNLEQILNVIGEFNQITYKFKSKNSVELTGAGCE